MWDLTRAPGEILDRNHFDPGHFTVSGFVTDPEVSRLVLIEHLRIGKWLQPGGHVDPDDATLVAGARREVAEETGLTDLGLEPPGLFDIDVHRVPARGAEPPHLHYDLRFWFRGPAAPLVATDEVGGQAWVDLDAVGEWTDDGSVVRAAAKLRGARAPYLDGS